MIGGILPPVLNESDTLTLLGQCTQPEVRPQLSQDRLTVQNPEPEMGDHLDVGVGPLRGDEAEGAVFSSRVQDAERPVPSARTLFSLLSCSRTSRMVWSLTPGRAVLMSARRNVTGARRRM